MTDGIGSIVIDNNPLLSATVDTYRRTLMPGEWKEGSYYHEIKAMGGFWLSSFQIIGPRTIIEEWLESGLGRRVRSFLPDGRLAWEGYVNTIRLETAGLTYEVSLDRMSNRVWTSYISSAPSQEVGSTVQINDPEALARLLLFGETNKTRGTVYNNTVSQGKYGIKEIVLSGGEMSATIANQTAQAYLALAYDPIRGQMRIQGGSDRAEPVKLTIECQGYMRTLGWRTYNHTGGSTAQVAALIATIVSAVGAFIASTAIDANTSAVAEDYNTDRFAESILLDLARVGDASFNRYVLGVYNDRKLIYKQAASAALSNIFYTINQNGSITDPQNRRVNLAEIRPDKWLREGRVFGKRLRLPATLYEDLSAAYVESVTYREPDNITIIGNKGNQLDAVLSQLTLNGLGAI